MSSLKKLETRVRLRRLHGAGRAGQSETESGGRGYRSNHQNVAAGQRKKIADEAKLKDGIGRVTQGIVDVLNSLHADSVSQELKNA